MAAMGERAKAAKEAMRLATAQQKSAAIHAMAYALRANQEALLQANAKDVAHATAQQQTPARIDRLRLDAKRVTDICDALQVIADYREPVGRVLETVTRPNGLRIEQVTVPLGVIGVIYESRPNVTADAAALAIKAGNTIILRSSSECLNSAVCIATILRDALAQHGLPKDSLQIIDQPGYDYVDAMLQASDVIDVMVPRGGKSLIERVNQKARMPVFSHLDGVCHIYVARQADLQKAQDLVVDAKLRRVTVCGALETLLVDQSLADEFLPRVLLALREKGCEIRGCERTQAIDNTVIPASAQDWVCEYLDAILSIRIVDDLDMAIAHINHHGSHHTDTIVTEDDEMAVRFMNEVDSAIVMHNASTQFADGNEFGKGGEIGIATGRIHARGPVGCDELTCFHYRVHGSGQCRA
ncbi:MAG: glutamate-5-semialdehyde dehydrogenase [Pseudomonadota bacterium]